MQWKQIQIVYSSPSPKTPSTPTTPGGSKMNGPMFSFTDPALQKKAATVKETLLMWCQMKTKEYEVAELFCCCCFVWWFCPFFAFVFRLKNCLNARVTSAIFCNTKSLFGVGCMKLTNALHAIFVYYLRKKKKRKTNIFPTVFLRRFSLLHTDVIDTDGLPCVWVEMWIL